MVVSIDSSAMTESAMYNNCNDMTIAIVTSMRPICSYWLQFESGVLLSFNTKGRIYDAAQ